MSVRQYTGARYVPIFGRAGEESIEWDNTKPYEPLTIVLWQGNSYTSRQYVPVGVDIANQEFWAQTGNYNAQVDAYRREVLEFADEIKNLESAKVNGILNREIIYREDVFQSYLSSDLPENEYSTIQGVTETDTTIIYTQNPASYWGNTLYVEGFTNTLRYVERLKSAPATIVRSEVVNWHHGNSMSYDSKRDCIYVVDMYDKNQDDTTTWLNTISVYDHQDPSHRIGQFTIAGSESTYYDGVSYDAETDTIAAFTFNKNTNKAYCYILDAETKSVQREIHLTECEQIYNYVFRTTERTMGSFFQSGAHTKDYLIAVTFHPNTLIFMDWEGHVLRIANCSTTEVSTDELEDISFNPVTGDIIAGFHKRYDTRETDPDNRPGEAHEDIETLARMNIYTNVLPDTDYETAEGFNIVYVNPASTNIIQNGRKETPFVSVMEALNCLEKSIWHPCIYLVGSGSVPWIISNGQDLTILRTTSTPSSVKVGCVYCRNANVYLDHVDFEKVEGFLHNRFNSQGDVWFYWGSNVTIKYGSLPANSEDYIVVDMSTLRSAYEIGENATNVFRFTNAAVGAVNSNDAAKSTASGSCLVNFS